MKLVQWSCKAAGIALVALLIMSAGVVFNPTPAKAADGLILPNGCSLKIYGYTKLDALWTDQDGGGAYSYVPDAVLLDKTTSKVVPAGTDFDSDKASSKFMMHARQTRIGLATSTDTEYGKLKTVIETDFYGTLNNSNTTVSNSWGLRMRKAYGQLGNLLVGQNWSTFIDLNSYGETLDFGGPAGFLFIRQAQIRWTQPFNGGSLQFALENPTSHFLTYDPAGPTGRSNRKTTTPAKTISGSNQVIPDIIARANFDTTYGKYSISTMARNLRIDDDINHYNDNAWGYAVSLTASIPTIGKDNLILQFNYGDALGRYMECGFAEAFINPKTGEIEKNDQMGILAGYRHFWKYNLRSTILYSYASRDNDSKYVPDTVDEDYHSVHANIIWSPVSRVNIGAEYIWAYRELESDADGHMNRLQFSFQFNF